MVDGSLSPSRYTEVQGSLSGWSTHELTHRVLPGHREYVGTGWWSGLSKDECISGSSSVYF